MDNSKIYKVKCLDPLQQEWWKDTDLVKVEHFPWGTNGPDDYRPVTNARLGTNGDSLFIFMETDEINLRSETKGFGHVHTDSCMEFFVAPDASSLQYLNFEFNPAAAMYLSIGIDRYNREVLLTENYRDLFNVKTVVHDRGWNLEFHIPLSFLKRFFPFLELERGRSMRGNFYKCGDNTARPHFGCWSPIDLPKPDFHCPAFFGTLTFV